MNGNGSFGRPKFTWFWSWRKRRRRKEEYSNWL